MFQRKRNIQFIADCNRKNIQKHCQITSAFLRQIRQWLCVILLIIKINSMRKLFVVTACQFISVKYRFREICVISYLCVEFSTANVVNFSTNIFCLQKTKTFLTCLSLQKIWIKVTKIEFYANQKKTIFLSMVRI